MTRRRTGTWAAAALTSLLVLLGPPAAAQTADPLDVLVFHNAAGFVHPSIPAGIAAFQAIGVEQGFEVTSTDDPTVFTDEQLSAIDVVVLLNTTADAVPDASNQAAFERWYSAGGAWMGVHSAADTEYDWAFYGDLLGGAYFKNHPVQQSGTAIIEDTEHPATAHLGEQWEFVFEEFYSFVASPRPVVSVLASMDESSYDQDPNTSNLPNSPTFPEGETGVMGDHPMVWCHDVNGGRAFYTAFGHESYLYALPDFRQHLAGGLRSVAGLDEAACHEAAPASTDTTTDPTDDTEQAPTPSGDILADTGGGGALAALVLFALAGWALRRTLEEQS